MHRRFIPARRIDARSIAVVLLFAWATSAPAPCQEAASDADSPQKAQTTGKAASTSDLLGDNEIDAIAGGIAADAVFGEGDGFGQRIRQSLQLPPVAGNGVAAAFQDERYGPHARNVLDLWTVQSEDAAPLVVFIHGGGFRRGDKSLLYDTGTLVQLIEAGVAVAAVNYRFSHQCANGTLGSLHDVARAVQFMRHHAERYNIDKTRVACYGGSAGAAASLWLAFAADLADANSDDPVSRESTRLSCAGAMATPSTLDLLRWPEVLGISRDQAIAAAKRFGVRDAAELESEEGVQMRRQIHLIGLMSPGDPPIFVHNNQHGGPPEGVAQMAHHPNHARVLKDRAEQLGVTAVVNAPRIGIVDASNETLVSFLLRHLQVKADD